MSYSVYSRGSRQIPISSAVKGLPLDLYPMDISKQLQGDQPGEPATGKREFAKNKMADPKKCETVKNLGMQACDTSKGRE